jgi:hypothetical protein
LSEASIEFLRDLKSKQIGDCLSSPVEGDQEIMGQITSELDRPIYILNLLLEDRIILGLVHSYFVTLNTENTGVYHGDIGASLLFEMGYKLRKLRDEYQPQYIEKSKRYYESQQKLMEDDAT